MSPAVLRRAAVTPEGAKPARDWPLPLAVAVGAAAVFAVIRPHLIDDTYITLAYAENLALHGHWGLIAESTSNTATSPLNVLALAALTVPLRDAVLAAGVLFVACQVLTLLGLRRLGTLTGLPGWFAPASVGLLVVNPLLLSSVGLEIAPGVAALSWLLVFAVERRAFAVGAVAGVVALLRLDLLVIVAVIVVARAGFWRGAWRSLLTFAAVTLPWFVVSWLVLGSAVPDTLVIKTLQRTWGGWSFTNGVKLYWEHFPVATALSFLVLPLAGVVGLLWIVKAARGSAAARAFTPFAALAIGGVLHYAAYMWLNVPPYHWYYGPSLAAATVFLVAAGARWLPRVGLAATAVLAAASVALYAAPGLPREHAPITSNHASSERYLEIAADLGRIAPGATVRAAGEIGVLAYGCDCAMIDLFSDRGAIVPAIDASRERSSAVGRVLLDANFTFFDRGVRPVRPDFVLELTSDVPPPTALASWTITSPWAGTQQLYLVRAADAKPPKPLW